MAGLDYKLRMSAESLRELYKDAARAPGVMQIELRRGIKKAGIRVQRAVAIRASGFSRQIPGKVKVRSSFAARNPGVSIVVDDRSGEAAALNNKNRAGTFRHPVFGDRENWVRQTAHPFFVSSAHPAAVAAAADISDVMDRVGQQLHFSGGTFR